MSRTYKSLFLSVFALSVAHAQQPGRIENQEITVEKSRRIELPPADRIQNKIPSPKANTDAKKLTYEFQDRKLTIGDPRIQPTVLPLTATKAEVPTAFTNYVKIGAGNYNTFYGEGFYGLTTESGLGVEASARHLGSGIGPVDGANSAQRETRLDVKGTYNTDLFKLTGGLGFEQERYFFYGYRPQFLDGNRLVPNRDSLRQQLSTFRVNLGIENNGKDQTLDYALKTSLTTLKDAYRASETDWATNLQTSLAITDNVIALLNADAYITQRTDQEIDNRNLFRLRPAFRYTSPKLTITAGLNAVNETDKRLGINNTLAFPVANVDVVPAGNIHFFAGVDGDIVRNTLRSFLSENRWMAPNLVLANTVKSYDLYGGSKGQLGNGFNFEGKVSYARYRNFYGINNSWPDTSKFFAVYDGGIAHVLTISGQLGYSLNDRFTSTLKGDVFRYDLDRLDDAWGRPRATVQWLNSYTLNKKLFVTSDLYVNTGIRNKNFVTNEVVQLPVIYDLNLKIDYFLGKQLSAFVSLNNIFGQTYQRYLYYRVQGLNFLGGISYSF
ncbi:TonB-dependent receptor [Fibrivirga algicola]|uniref:TonB-dependent receptor n=1 Tax=Fibrivirga algicola TaxID=2950420 RepID=A0ABX0QMD3_9BACT|nr:TonB-dependent receptor [Fibrivirga algicola]NID12441.1 TonB-dependent receptor [Fibrivirga algicola]